MSRMARERWVSAERGQPSPHGGPARLVYRLTASGERARKRALDQARRDYERLLFSGRLSDAARRLLQDPPRGSALEAARNYGVDLTLLAKTASATPQERFDEALNGMRFLAGIKR
jgi:DNA-binding PadR family transcriptional regulator